MSRIETAFAALKSARRCALIPFVTAGDPAPEITVDIMHALVRGGADLLELGVPFSDPMADGPVIQRASERALKHGVTLRNVLDMVSVFRRDNQTTPVILMGYLNPIEVMGYTEFAEAGKAAGVDGVLIVDLPPEEAEDFADVLAANNMDQVFLLAPTTSPARIERIAGLARGFIYYVSLKGVTGSDRMDIDDVAGHVNEIKSKTDLPVGVGFGIRDAATAAKVAAISDAVVIGSALVDKLQESAHDRGALLAEAEGFMQAMRKAMDAAGPLTQ
ncbi:MAG: tryptophan synthase subunit alpha [Gammaproteobacteria bacterium]